MMTKEQIQAIRERAGEAASQTPESYSDYIRQYIYIFSIDIPALLAEVERLQSEKAALVGACRDVKELILLIAGMMDLAGNSELYKRCQANYINLQAAIDAAEGGEK